MDAGPQGFEPSFNAFSGHNQGAVAEAEQLEHDPASIRDVGASR